MLIIGFAIGFLGACGMYAGWKLANLYYAEIGKQ